MWGNMESEIQQLDSGLVDIDGTFKERGTSTTQYGHYDL
jgi:hypothetical protein